MGEAAESPEGDSGAEPPPPTDGKAGKLGKRFKTDTAILPRASLGLHDKNRDDEPKPVDSESLALGLGGMVRGQGQRSVGAMEGFSLLVRPEKCLGRPQR